MRDEIIYSTIKEAIKLIDEIDAMINSQAEELQKVDYEISDWLHYIENNETTGKENEKIIKKLKELRIKRKSLHKEHAIEKAYKDNSNKMMAGMYSQDGEHLWESDCCNIRLKIIKNDLLNGGDEE